MEGFLKQYDAANLEKLNTLFAQVEKSTSGLPRENLDALWPLLERILAR